MSQGDEAYLVMVIAAFAIFGIALAIGSWYERAGAKSDARHQPPKQND